MCGLCGALGGEDNWTMGAVDPGRASHLRRQERRYRLVMINRALAPFRVVVDDFQGQAYVVRTLTGAQELVTDLGGIWPAAERLSSRAIDPLDETYLRSLSR
ncbi:hypothetical protein [Aquisalimonas asiatica]|uniref:Uncharacterized protein n=1 Tax=Aquisalimonas asiatica TaxID=406100 RepID=A0A1H8RHS5_9GAMM|nr:hypothetical protein [Aquisalimonas asiatica]SEO66021.1 hypothetical protein SAMN04488052_10238 [Aquisalimonas asiatica]